MKQILPVTPTPVATPVVAADLTEQQAYASADFTATLKTLIKEGSRIVDQAELDSILNSGIDLTKSAESWRGITASAWITNKDITKVLLVQPEPSSDWVAAGGAILEGESAHAAALRHAHEQLGLSIQHNPDQSPERIYDVDVGRDPLHSGNLGADLLYLVFGHEDQPINKGNGIHDAQWVDVLDLLELEPARLMGTATKTYWFGEGMRLERALREM